MGLSDMDFEDNIPRPEMWTPESIVQAVRDGFTFLIPFLWESGSRSGYYILRQQYICSGVTVGPEHTEIIRVTPEGWLEMLLWFSSWMVPDKAFISPVNDNGVGQVWALVDPKEINWDSLNRGTQIRTKMPRHNPAKMKLFQIDEFNPEQPFIYNGVCFDPVSGSGAVGNSANINYKGFVVWISPQTFLSLCHPLPYERQTSTFMQQTLPRGEWCICPPLLYIDKEDDSNDWHVKGHEGRHRALALQRLGFDHIPVFIFPYEIRARHLTEELINEMMLLQNEDDTALEFLNTKVIVIDEKVYVRAGDQPHLSRGLQAHSRIWQQQRPIPIKTMKQKESTGHPDSYYYYSLRHPKRRFSR